MLGGWTKYNPNVRVLFELYKIDKSWERTLSLTISSQRGFNSCVIFISTSCGSRYWDHRVKSCVWCLCRGGGRIRHVIERKTSFDLHYCQAQMHFKASLLFQFWIHKGICWILLVKAKFYFKSPSKTLNLTWLRHTTIFHDIGPHLTLSGIQAWKYFRGLKMR